MFRKDVPLFQVVSFQEFDHGKKVAQVVEGKFKLNSGDVVEWEAGSQFHGLAEIISAEPPSNGWTRFIMKKRS